MKKKYLLIKLFFIMMISFLILASIVIPSVAEESKVDNENITVELPEVIETTDIRNLLKTASDITVVDVTGLILGKETQHEHLWKTMYDETNHWEECTVCGEKNNIQIHSYKDNGWLRGTKDTCYSDNMHVFICDCGYSYETSEGRKEHVWFQANNDNTYSYCETCRGCNQSISRNSHQCKKSDGSDITCINLGRCSICGYNYTKGKHCVIVEPNETDEVSCYICNTNLGKINYNYVINVGEGIYEHHTSLTVPNGTVYNNKEDYTYDSAITTSSISNFNGTTWTNVRTIKYNSHSEMDSRSRITYITTNGNMNIIYYIYSCTYADEQKPIVEKITVGDDELSSEWSKTKTLTISGTENYCNTVTAEILDDEENTVYKGKAAVINNNYSISCTPEIEAGLNGRTFTAIVTDACNNSTTQEFTIRKVDAVAPHVISGTEVMGDWAKEKEFTFEAIDNGIGNVSIAFNDIETVTLLTLKNQ